MTPFEDTPPTTTVVIEWWTEVAESNAAQGAEIGRGRISRGVRVSVMRRKTLPSHDLDAELRRQNGLSHPPEYVGSTLRHRIRFVLGSAFGVCVTLLVQLLL